MVFKSNSNTPSLIAHGLGVLWRTAFFLYLFYSTDFFFFFVFFVVLGASYIFSSTYLNIPIKAQPLGRCERQNEHSIEQVLKGNVKIDLESAWQWPHWSFRLVACMRATDRYHKAFGSLGQITGFIHWDGGL